MRICPNCGSQSADNAAFCGECGFAYTGTPVSQSFTQEQDTAQQTAGYDASAPYGAQQPYGAQGAYGVPAQPKKKSKLPLIIGIAAAAVALIVIAIVLIVRLTRGGTSNNDFVGVQESFLDERFSFLETTQQEGYDTYSTDITVSAEISGRGDIADTLGKLLDGTAIVVKVDNTDDTLVNVVLNLKGSNVLEMLVRYDGEDIAFAMPNVDGKSYIADAETFLQTMNIDLDDFSGVPQEDAQRIRAYILDVMPGRYLGVLRTAITPDNLTIERNKDVRLEELGTTVKGTLFTWEPSAEDLETFIETLADTIEEDEELRDMIEIIWSVSSSGNYYEYLYGSVDNMIYEMTDDMRDEARSFGREMENGGFNWQVLVDSKGNLSLIQVEMEEVTIAYERTVSGDEITETLYALNGRSTAFSLENDYTKKGTQRTGKLTLNTPDGRIGLDYDLDTSKHSVFYIPYGEYTLDARNLGLPGITMTVADGGSGSSDHIIELTRLDSLTYDMLSDMTITINTTDTSSAVAPSGNEQDVRDYSERELNNLLSDLVSGAVRDLTNNPEMQDIMDLLYYLF